MGQNQCIQTYGQLFEEAHMVMMASCLLYEDEVLLQLSVEEDNVYEGQSL